MSKIEGALLCLLLIAGCKQHPEPASSSRPNILFLISDDHSGDDLSILGKDRPRTPALDRLCSEGVRFTNAYASSPQCSPSRASMLTGRSPHATGTSRLHSTLTEEHDTVIDALRRAGYYVGAYNKVHLGERFQSRWQFYGDKKVPYEKFFRDRPRDRPFFLWIGFDDPHRPYQTGTAMSPPFPPAQVRVPGFLPNTDAVRQDLADYYDEVSRMDSDAAKLLSMLESKGLSQNTLVVFAGDNGMPFPGAKGSLYHDGVHVPLIVRWPGRVAAGQVHTDIVSLLDLAPTWLESAGLKPLPYSEGKSLLPMMTTQSKVEPRAAFFERNWHDNLDLIRGVRSGPYLLIQNYRAELPYPPTLDVEASPSWISIEQMHRLGTLASPLERRYFTAPRPEAELYNLQTDPYQLQNLANISEYKTTLAQLQKLLSDRMIATNDFLPPPIPPQRGTQGEAAHP